MNYESVKHKRQLRNDVIAIFLILSIIISSSVAFKLAIDRYKEVKFEITRNETINDLENLATTNPQISSILNNINEYPYSLLELASNNLEAVDFVYNYPNKSNNLVEATVEYNPLDGIPLLIQWDERWGYDMYGDNFMGVNGCAPTVVSMVVIGLTGNTEITPKYVSDYSYSNNYYVDEVGTNWDLIIEGIEVFGIVSEEVQITEEDIISTLESGFPIIATVRPGNFTTTGHFIILTGISSDEKITINDPNSIEKSNQLWDLEVFLEESKKLWKISTI